MSSPPKRRKRFTAAPANTINLKPSYNRFQAGRKQNNACHPSR